MVVARSMKGTAPMIKLSDTQLIILTAATQRPERIALPLPASLKGGAAQKVVASLIAKGLLKEVKAVVGDAVWRKTGNGRNLTLVATDAALAALGIEPEDATSEADTGGTGGDDQTAAADTAGDTEAAPVAPKAPRVRKAARPKASGSIGIADLDKSQHPIAKANKASWPTGERKTRENSKQAQMIAMLQRPEGATVVEIAAAFGWQHHTVRGAIAGALRKKLGLGVISEKVEGRGRVYRLGSN